MSFTMQVKDEISKLRFGKPEEISRLSAIVSTSEVDNIIHLETENNSSARLYYSLFKDIFNIHPMVSLRKGYNYNKKTIYVIEVKKDVPNIIKTLGITKTIPEEFITDDFDLTRAYLNGVFLSKGSINDPKTSRYHLEINIINEDLAKFIKDLLNKYDLNAKIIKRDNKYMIYLKEAEKIADFLRLIDATNALLYYEDIRIYRDHKNMTNRLNNCEQANMDKVIQSASNEVKDIELIKETYSLDDLPEKEKVAAEYRLKYPDSSLDELAKIITLETGEEISKSGIYHRLKKLKDLANKIRSKK